MSLSNAVVLPDRNSASMFGIATGSRTCIASPASNVPTTRARARRRFSRGGLELINGHPTALMHMMSCGTNAERRADVELESLSRPSPALHIPSLERFVTV
jgi:hypothetical protein